MFPVFGLGFYYPGPTPVYPLPPFQPKKSWLGYIGTQAQATYR
jgi:hypothetical protein